MEGEFFRGLDFFDGGHGVFLTITREMIERLRLDEDDLDNVAALGSQIEGVDRHHAARAGERRLEGECAHHGAHQRRQTLCDVRRRRSCRGGGLHPPREGAARGEKSAECCRSGRCRQISISGKQEKTKCVLLLFCIPAAGGVLAFWPGLW